MKNFNNRDYTEALQQYLNGDKIECLDILNQLELKDIPEFDSDTRSFIFHLNEYAERNNDRDLLSHLHQLTRRMNLKGSNGVAQTIVNTIETLDDCLVLIDNSLTNGLYEVTLSKIVEFIKRKKNFKLAYTILEHIEDSSSVSSTEEKGRILFYYIDRINDLVETDIKPKMILPLIYISHRWNSKQFDSDKYVLFNRKVKMLKKKYRR